MRKTLLNSMLISLAILAFHSCDKPLNKKNETSENSEVENLKPFAKRYARAWSSQVPDSVASFFSVKGSLRVNDGDPAVGAEEISQFASSFMTDFPDMLVRYDSLVLNSGNLEFHWTLIGTNTGPGGTGNKVKVSGYEVWQLGSEGLIEKSQGHFPSEEYNRQLGLVTDAVAEEDFIDLDVTDLNNEIRASSENLSPKEIMKMFYPVNTESGEGNERIVLSEDLLDDGTTVVELIHENMMDDSVRSKKYVMGLKSADKKWQVVFLKNNWKCWPGRGHEDWGTETCK